MRDLLLASARDGDKAEETRNGVGTAVSVTRQWTRLLVRRMTHTLTKWKAVVQSCTTKQIIDVPFFEDSERNWGRILRSFRRIEFPIALPSGVSTLPSRRFRNKMSKK